MAQAEIKVKVSLETIINRATDLAFRDAIIEAGINAHEAHEAKHEFMVGWWAGRADCMNELRRYAAHLANVLPSDDPAAERQRLAELRRRAGGDA